MKIFLVGFMGCGKSYVGKRLSAKLGFQFIDADNVIENTEGMTIAQIFTQFGEAHFRQIEADTLRRFAKWDDVVISTGGGAACFHDNMDWMNAHGLTVYLKASPQLLMSRLKSEADHRPILGGRTDADLLQFIADKLNERSVFYEQARLIVEQESDGEQVVADVIQALFQLANAL
ncbi:MAG: AAA family ATPase [Saprospiraceae bacterium]|nr:AAA family ATPase [Saprospiraceae bacterium]